MHCQKLLGYFLIFFPLIGQGFCYPMMIRLFHSRSRRFPPRSVITLLQSSFFEGSEVSLRTGGKGRLLQKMKRGDVWKVQILVDEEVASNAAKIVKLKSSEFTALANDGDETLPENGNLLVASTVASNKDKQTSFADIIVPRITEPRRHAEIGKWVIFSDLHVKANYADVCEQVLHAVHEFALSRNAGIIFLGDFWHTRGAIAVEVLNRILRALKLWTQPVIMIPGNHDQVSLGGDVHALEPLKYAFSSDQILMISEPSVCLGALWIPYRRDPRVMKAVLDSVTSSNDIDIVFCHADVRGAFMNDGVRSREGLDLDMFPSNVPVYSGHFHKPHMMKQRDASIIYVGSPYQVSLAEAHQTKYLYCLSCTPASPLTTIKKEDGSATMRYEWKELEKAPFDIGKKYYKVTSLEDPSFAKAKRGDKVVIPDSIFEDYPSRRKLELDLNERGVEYELRKEPRELIRPKIDGLTDAVGTGDMEIGAHPLANSTIEGTGETISATLDLGKDGEVDALDPLTIFSRYMGSSGCSEHFADLDIADNKNFTSKDFAASGPAQAQAQDKASVISKVIVEGRATVERLMGSLDVSSPDRASEAGDALLGKGKKGKSKTDVDASAFARVDSDHHRACNLRLEQVSLTNFGPYGGKSRTHYPLANRGLVLLTGRSSDGTGADSNGSGKTTLAMSVMWGLTGSMDARLVADGKAVDVTFDGGSSSSPNKRVAEVMVTGTINGAPFSVTRRRGAKKSDLSFTVDGKDLTTQSMKDTQVVVDDVLGVGNGLLQRCCFFGQHSHTLQSLLGLSDGKLKSELGVLVDTRIWVAALQDTRNREKQTTARLAEVNVEHRLCVEDIVNREKALSFENQTLDRLYADLEAAKSKVLEEMGRSRDAMGSQSVETVVDELENVKRELDRIRVREIAPAKESQLQQSRVSNARIAEVDKKISAQRERMAHIKASVQAAASAGKVALDKTKTIDSQLQQLNTTALSLVKALGIAVNTTTRLNNSSIAGEILSVEIGSVLEDTKSRLDSQLALYASLSVRLKAVNASLARIDELVRDIKSGKNAASPDNGGACQEHSSQDENCPTCGQNMPVEKRLARKQEVTEEFLSLKQESGEVSKLVDELKKRLDWAGRLKTTQDSLAGLKVRLEEMTGEVAVHAKEQTRGTDELAALEAELKSGLYLERNKLVEMNTREEADIKHTLAELEKKIFSLQSQESDLDRKIKQMRSSEIKCIEAQTAVNKTVVVLEEQIRLKRESRREKMDDIEKLQFKLGNFTAQQQLLFQNITVLKKLGDVFGARGIQHYVFTDVVRQIEGIANIYLSFLADGGIQLALQGDVDGEKIVKSVYVRSDSSSNDAVDVPPDISSSFRERGLGQLSGGQWRRVSMALDLAFAEVVRRRGTLRCNLLVMDEVLTHLDSTGREAVGSLLRSLVDGHRPGEREGAQKPQSQTTRLVGLAQTDAKFSEGSGEGLSEPIEKGDSKGRDEAAIEYIYEGSSEADGEAGSGVSNSNTAGALLEEEMRRLLLGGGAYETVLVILQDIAALEMEESFDHVDVVVKTAQTASVEIDGALKLL